eukprot:8200176-Heterocapsa_arctica.AAC.1
MHPLAGMTKPAGMSLRKVAGVSTRAMPCNDPARRKGRRCPTKVYLHTPPFTEANPYRSKRF